MLIDDVLLLPLTHKLDFHVLRLDDFVVVFHLNLLFIALLFDKLQLLLQSIPRFNPKVGQFLFKLLNQLVFLHPKVSLHIFKVLHDQE